MKKIIKKFLLPSRKYVEWRFDQTNEEIKNQNDFVIQRINELYEKNSESADYQSKMLKELCNDGNKLEEYIKELCFKQKNIEEEIYNIKEKNRELAENNIQLKEQNQDLINLLKELKTEISDYKTISLNKQEANRQLLIKYQKELAGRIFEEIPTYMKGLHYPERKTRIIITMTSYKERIQFTAPAIYSLLHQTLKPDKVLLWLARENFPAGEEELPQDLLDLKDLGLSICWCEEDIKPHKKYYYTMKEYPDDIIITVDDDVLYRPHQIEDLYRAYQNYPDAIYTTRARQIKMTDEGELYPYNDWPLFENSYKKGPSFDLIPTGVGAVLYPPHCLDEELFQIEEIRELCLYTDDLWLKLMSLKKRTKVVKIDWFYEINYVEGSQEIALYLVNQGKNQNDLTIEKMKDYFRQRGKSEEEIKNMILNKGE